MLENRKAPRRYAVKGGTIRFRGRSVDCLVRNLSISGATLELGHESTVPSRFVLQIPGDGVSLASRVVWRKEHYIGISFG
jgi:PilZ domain